MSAPQINSYSWSTWAAATNASTQVYGAIQTIYQTTQQYPNSPLSGQALTAYATAYQAAVNAYTQDEQYFSPGTQSNILAVLQEFSSSYSSAAVPVTGNGAPIAGGSVSSSLGGEPITLGNYSPSIGSTNTLFVQFPVGIVCSAPWMPGGNTNSAQMQQLLQAAIKANGTPVEIQFGTTSFSASYNPQTRCFSIGMQGPSIPSIAGSMNQVPGTNPVGALQNFLSSN
jgi:hypothetical protein